MSDDATRAQIEAARPQISTWLSANAGSGKTRVLTDRVARLLLGGVQPQNILCLTYTKAAATEMQNRLFRRLGQWAMKPDAPLRADLVELGEEPETLDAPRMALARQLFARAIETPGGLRIQTIHSFCATLLRRYPLEAGVSPGFTEMDDRTARALRDDILQDLADRLAPAEMAAIADLHPSVGIEALTAEICANAPSFSRELSPQEAASRFGLRPGDTADTLLGDLFLGLDAAFFVRVAGVLLSVPSGAKSHAPLLLGIDPANPTLAMAELLEGILLFGPEAKAGPYSAKIDKYANAEVRRALGADLERLHLLMTRVEAARPRRLGLLAAENLLVLNRFARRFLTEYERRKAERGLLDFDDLIRRAGRLLNDPALAAWVLFRLDGGIDHILVDEAQDTSPPQWQVIERLTAEFTAGAGARAETRTLFVVGDKKQSIYSFQGADLSAFDRRHTEFRARFAEVGQPMQDRSLDYSFRSAPAVLQVVDATFGAHFPAALGKPPHHLAFFDALPGRVDLWPLIPQAVRTADENGWDPVDLPAEDHHTVQLAQEIAAEIRAMIEGRVQIVDEAKVTRPVRPGDFLILVQRRAELFAQIIRACKQQGLAIAGADRLKLGEELAVKDLKALLAFLATPEDDLSLAAALRSPLFGWSEDRLFRLAHGRKGFLWEALRQSGQHAETLAVLNDLRDQVDFLRPYEILERMLTRHRGRERLLTRLGPEAEDGIDELLTQALVYEQTDVPGLTGFLVWLEADEVEVKRQLGGEGDSIRVMTVHGAKGLEANVVILPDTADRNPRDRTQIYRGDDGAALWKPPAPQMTDELRDLSARQKDKSREESLRLLYVALTRARCWLIVAGAGEARTEANKQPKAREELCWYLQVQTGLQALNPAMMTGGRLRHETGVWPSAGGTLLPRPAPVALPDWIGLPAVDPPRRLPDLTPSDLGGAKALPGDGDLSELATARGTALHRLLEHLPAHDPADWGAVARSLLDETMDVTALLSEAAGVLGAPSLGLLFGEGSLAEVAITGMLGGRRVVGAIDRLIVGPDRVLAVDFKSNRVVPDSAATVPEGILRQMGAYAHLLGAIYPGRRIETAILWTAEPRLMPLDPDIVTAALGRATIA